MSRDEPVLAHLRIPDQRVSTVEPPVQSVRLHEALVSAAVEEARTLGRLEVADIPGRTATDGVFSLARWQSPFKAQNDRGSSWAFAGAAALEAAYRRKFGVQVDVSEEYIFHLGKAFALNRDAQQGVVEPVENNSSLTGFQGAGDVVRRISENAVPPETAAPYISSQRALLEVLPTLGYSSGQASLTTQEDFDALEFCEQHIPLVARVNARYRSSDWATLGERPSIQALENTLLGDHEVVCDVTHKTAPTGGHVLLLVGFDSNRRVFLAKNHWGENAFIEIAYEDDPHWSIDSGWFIKDVVNPAVVSAEACWLGTWWLSMEGRTHRMLLRRSQDLADPGRPTRLGSIYLDDGRHDVNGHFVDGGLGVRLYIAPGTAPTATGTLEGTRVDARLDPADVYNSDGLLASGAPVTLTRFTTRFAALWEESDGTAWQARHGLDGAAYQQAFDELVADGYRPTSVSGYSEGRGSRLNAIWVKGGDAAWEARHGLTGEEFQRAFHDLARENYRLTCVSGYAEHGEARYAAIWERSLGPDWHALHGLTGKRYQLALDELSERGYGVTQVSGYRVGATVLFAAIWERMQDVALVGRHGLTASQHQRNSDVLEAQGFRMTSVSGYSDSGAARYASAWRQETSPAWQSRHGLSAVDLQRTIEELAAQGLRPVQVSGYGDGAYPA